MLPSNNDLLAHVRLLDQTVRLAGAELLIAGESLHALIRRGPEHWTLQPRFLATLRANEAGPRREYTESFAGWLPYAPKVCPASADALEFKCHAAAAGLAVPEHYTAADAVRDVVVKRPTSSPGAPVRGPFRAAEEAPLQPEHGEYYERFIPGDLVRIWFWEETPICAELRRMPHVVGDGASTIRELITVRAQHRQQGAGPLLDTIVASCAQVLRYFGTDVETVVPRGTIQLVHFRHSSALWPPGGRHTLDLTVGAPRPPWVEIVRNAGPALAAAIPDELRSGTLFTADAILDAAGKLWFLGMDLNPATHPLAYRPMVHSLIGPARTTPAAAPNPPEPAARPQA